jgi:DNA-binding response OmpR family regulator
MVVEPSQPLDVLIIEDDPDIQALLQHYLTQLGCDVAVASTGHEGLLLAMSLVPEVVFVDVMLPDMLGNDVIDALRTEMRSAGCQIIVLSALEPDLHGARADIVMTKPFTRDDLMSALNRLSWERFP